MKTESYVAGILEVAFKTITPWKKKYYPESNEDTIENTAEWVAGWNACLKEIKKNRKNYIKFVEEKFTK